LVNAQQGRRVKYFGPAQDCILLDRGFPSRRPLARPAGVENPASSRLEIGNTADSGICAAKNFVPHPHDNGFTLLA